MAMERDAVPVVLHRDAPEKPASGDACNGCGVCCAAETCPAGRLLFRTRGACPALAWSAAERRYLCGLVAEPAAHLPLAAVLARPAAALFRRWIAAGKGCDCDYRVDA